MISQPEAWIPAPLDLRLGEEEVHVWSASLEADASHVAAFRAVLTQDELERADRFHFERDRQHFVVGRGLLRDILSRYLRTSPAQIRFSYNEYGKPALAAADAGLRFNLAHSHGVALYALTRGREIGVDVELLRDDFASLEIAENFFSRMEVGVLRTLPAHQQTQGFFNCWTRKEAYIKALGEGLSHPLHRFAVTLAPGEPARLVSTDNDPLEASRWSLVELNPFTGYASALAVQGSRPMLHRWKWRE